MAPCGCPPRRNSARHPSGLWQFCPSHNARRWRTPTQILSSSLRRRTDTPTQFAGTSLAPPWAVGTDGQPLQTGGDTRQSWLCHKTTDFGTAGPQGRDVINPRPGAGHPDKRGPAGINPALQIRGGQNCARLGLPDVAPGFDLPVRGRRRRESAPQQGGLPCHTDRPSVSPPIAPDGGPIGTVRDCLSPNPALYRTPLKMAHSRLTRSQRRRSSERNHRRRWLPVKRDNGNRVRYKRPGLVPLRGKGHQCPCTTP